MSTDLEQRPEKGADNPTVGTRRSRARNKRRARPHSQVVQPGMAGGRYQPLAEGQMAQIFNTALDILEHIGLADAIPETLDRALSRGARLNDQGRLCFQRQLVQEAIEITPSEITLYARDKKHDIRLGGDRVHFATCGEAVRVPDFTTGQYRNSTLEDLYDFARLTDQLDHIHYFGQTIVATELSEQPYIHDINAIYACLTGTTKHVGIDAVDAKHLKEMFEIACLLAGGEETFRARPFVSICGCPIVAPLTFSAENSEVLNGGVQYDMPVEFAVVPQSGATGPAPLAGALALSTAETLAAVLQVQLLKPGHPLIVGNWPFVSDLRTGSFSGGGGEQAVMGAAAIQMVNYLDLPSHVGAAMSDAKLPDAQAGIEKTLSVALAAHAGGNLISEAAGMLGSLMGCSFEAMVIDNEMLGNIMRTVRGIEVSEDTLSYEVIRDVVAGEGHFLGHQQTLGLMSSEYLYPQLSDRNNITTWEEDGSKDMHQRARQRAREILSSYYPAIDPDVDAEIRKRFPIKLAMEDMQPGAARWNLS